MRKLDDDLDVDPGRRRPTKADPHVLLTPTERKRIGRNGNVALPQVEIPAPVAVG